MTEIRTFPKNREIFLNIIVGTERSIPVHNRKWLGSSQQWIADQNTAHHRGAKWIQIEVVPSGRLEHYSSVAHTHTSCDLIFPLRFYERFSWLIEIKDTILQCTVTVELESKRPAVVQQRSVYRCSAFFTTYTTFLFFSSFVIFLILFLCYTHHIHEIIRRECDWLWG